MRWPQHFFEDITGVVTPPGGGVGTVAGVGITPQSFGAAANGVANDAAAFNAWISAIGSTPVTLNVSSSILLSSSVTLPSNVTLNMVSPGKFLPAAATTLAINGLVVAPPTQIFGGSGTISFATGIQKQFFPEWWGALPSISNNSVALQACDVAASGAQGTINLTGGAYGFSTTLNLHNNVTWLGLGKNFGTGLLPTGSAQVAILGAQNAGGTAFRIMLRNMVVYSSQTTAVAAINVNTAYNIEFDDLWIYNVGTLSGNTQGIYTTAANQVVTRNVSVYGTGGAGQYGIYHDVGSIFHDITPDLEDLIYGMYITGSGTSGDVYTPYTERGGGIYINRSGAGNVNIYGGYCSVPPSSPIMILDTAATNVSIYGLSGAMQAGTAFTNGIIPQATSRGNSNLNIYGVASNLIGDANNILSKFPTSDAANLWVDTLYSYKTSLAQAITAISKAASAVVTVNTVSTTNPFSVGQIVGFANVGGMTQINGLYGTISAIGGASGAWTCTVNIASTGFTTYTSGGGTYVSQQKIFTPTLTSGNGMIDAELTVFASIATGGAPYAMEACKIHFMLTDPAGTVLVSNLVPMGNVIDQSASGNWAVELSFPITFTGNLAIAAVSGTLSANWAQPTGAYLVTMGSSGETRLVTLTNGAATATWSQPLWAATSTTAANVLSVQITPSGNTAAITLTAIPTGGLDYASNIDIFSELRVRATAAYVVTN